MVGGLTHCVCKKGTVRPQGSPRCVQEQLLQQYLNNIIANCTEIQKDLIEVYGDKIGFSNDPTTISYANTKTACDPNSKTSCKGKIFVFIFNFFSTNLKI